MEELIVLCREVNVNTGAVAVYELESEVIDNTLFCLHLRSRFNPELRYFVLRKKDYEVNKKDIDKMLRLKSYEKKIKIHGGIFML